MTESLEDVRRQADESLERSWARREARKTRRALWLFLAIIALALIADLVLNTIQHIR